MMDGFESRILQALNQRLTEEITKQTTDLGSGNAEDFAGYKNRAGRIAGLKDALSIAWQIEEDARGAQRGDRP